MMILYSVVPRVSALCKPWATKKALPFRVTWKCRFFTSQSRRGKDEESTAGQSDSAPSVQLERPPRRKRGENTWLSDEQKALLTNLRRDGLSMEQIQRDYLAKFSRSALYLHVDLPHQEKWTKEQDSTLLGLRAKGKTIEEIKAVAFPQTPITTLHLRIRRLLAQNPDIRNDLLARRPVTDHKIEQLSRFRAQGLTIAKIAEALGLSHGAVSKWIRDLNLGSITISRSSNGTLKRWTQVEDDFIRPYLAVRFLTRHFEALKQIPSWNRTYDATVQRLQVLRRKAGITKYLHKWNSQEIEFAVSSRADGLTLAEIAEKLGRKTDNVRAKLNNLARRHKVAG